MKVVTTLLALTFSVPIIATAQTTAPSDIPAAIYTDPAPDVKNPPDMEVIRIPTHGVQMNGIVYIASGAGPHPTAILLDGYPGDEQNLDLAQAMRRASWNVVYFHYRGSWGSGGDFSFSNAQQDCDAVLDYLLKNAVRLRSNPKKIIVVGHSMGGWMASYLVAHRPEILGGVLIAGVNMPVLAQMLEARTRVLGVLQDGIPALHGTSPDALYQELRQHPDWNMNNWVPQLAKKPLLFVVSTRDGLEPLNRDLLSALQKAGAQGVQSEFMDTDHAFSGKRISLETHVLQWIQQFAK